ncbi:IS110 family transposase [Sphingobium cloacae]
MRLHRNLVDDLAISIQHTDRCRLEADIKAYPDAATCRVYFCCCPDRQDLGVRDLLRHRVFSLPSCSTIVRPLAGEKRPQLNHTRPQPDDEPRQAGRRTSPRSTLATRPGSQAGWRGSARAGLAWTGEGGSRPENIEAEAPPKRNKTDTNDARGIAEITRTGRDYLTEVYVKSAACFEVRAQLIMRHRLVQQRLANENMIRGLLRVYGGRVEPGAKSSATYRDRVVEQLLIIQDREGINLRPRILPVLDLCERLQRDVVRIETELEALAAANPVCRRFMAVPGIGAITALSFFTAIEEPSPRAIGTDPSARRSRWTQAQPHPLGWRPSRHKGWRMQRSASRYRAHGRPWLERRDPSLSHTSYGDRPA